MGVGGEYVSYSKRWPCWWTGIHVIPTYLTTNQTHICLTNYGECIYNTHSWFLQVTKIVHYKQLLLILNEMLCNQLWDGSLCGESGYIPVYTDRPCGLYKFIMYIYLYTKDGDPPINYNKPVRCSRSIILIKDERASLRRPWLNK